MVNIIQSSSNLTETEINDAEKRWGIKIPILYRNFLLLHNSGYPDPSEFVIKFPYKDEPEYIAVDWFLGINVSHKTLNIEYTIDTFRDRIPAGQFPIAKDPGGGVICISTTGPNQGKIYYWDHEFETSNLNNSPEVNLYYIAENFDEFLSILE